MIKNLISTFKTLGRVLKNLFIRPFKTAFAKIRYVLSGRKLISAVPSAAKSLPKILKTKPEKREDYFDWGTVYIAKSLVLMIVLALILIPLLYILVLHPLLTSWFWTKDFVVGDKSLSSYSGKVRVYYDEDFEHPEFIGRLKDGKALEYGEEYHENGRYKYAGEFLDGLYENEGILYYEDGSVEYKGEFSKGRYNGVGTLYEQDGTKYDGTFQNGVLNGRGTITRSDVLWYDGSFSDGVINGEGKILFADGSVQYIGTFTDGLLNGAALEYYPNGSIKYNGNFLRGEYNGEGAIYNDNGKKLYAGSFEMGSYSGNGTLYNANGTKVYSGEFEEGLYNGSGTLYNADGSVTTGNFTDGSITGAATKTFVNGLRYEGCFSDNLMNGGGCLSDVTGAFSYTGSFLDDDIDYLSIIGAEPAEIRESIASLVQTVADDCFYLKDSSFGIAMKCRFAGTTSPAAVTEVFCRPFSGADIIIKSAEDIIAPTALSASRVENAQLPTWAAEEFGVSKNELTCYAVMYKEITVFYWCDSSGKLILRSADGSALVPDGGADADADGTAQQIGRLTMPEIAELFEELGLDPKDFSSFGFAEETEEE